MNTLSERELRVMLLVVRHASIRELARDLRVSIGSVQKILARLKRAGLMTSRPRLARMRELTEEGSDVLRREGLLK